MAKFQPWLKMWVEWIDDPKMLSLSLAEQGAWWRLITLTKKCAADGFLVKGNGAPLSLDEIANTLRITVKADKKVFDSMIDKMINLGSLHWNHDTLIVTHFTDRQAKTASETPEAVRDRVRRYRERKQQPPLDNPPLNNKGRERDKDIDIECNGVTPVTQSHDLTRKPSVAVTDFPLPSETIKDTICAEISKLYTENIGFIKPALADEIRDFCENFRGPVPWIELAFKEALSRNKKSWHYISTILENWQEKGGPDDTTRGQPFRGKGAGTEAHKRDSGWTDVGDEQEPPKTNQAGGV